MIDVGPITPWEMFKTLCMGMAFAKFNAVLLKSSGKTFKFIQADENSEEFMDWKEKNDNQKL